MNRRELLMGALAVAGVSFDALAQANTRVAIVIGVNKAGTLPVLSAAVSGAKQVSAWLAAESFEVHEFVDSARPVVVADVKSRIAQLIGRGNIEQLVVYFAGHGFASNYSEYWLLSNGLVDANEAISLKECHDLSRTFGFSNVVFISDACRSVPSSVNVSRILGSVVFPLGSNRIRPTRVDKFLATGVGEASWEVRTDAAEWESIFTTCLLDAFKCPPSSMVADDAEGKKVIPNRRLARYLETEVPQRAQAISLKLTQIPDTEISSDEPTFIAHVPVAQEDCKQTDARRPTPNLQDVANQMITLSSRGGSPSQLDDALRKIANSAGLDKAHAKIAVARGMPSEIRIRCGFIVSGAALKFVSAGNGVKTKISSTPDSGTIVEVLLPPDARAESVSMRFEDGSGTLLAALDEFIGTVVVDGGRVVNVSYVPAVNSAAYSDYRGRAKELDAMHASVASAARLGVFRLDGPDKSRIEASRSLASQIRLLKGYDPTLGLYAAYAYSDAGSDDQVRSVESIMFDGLGVDIFDVAMLAGKLNGRTLRPDRMVVPFIPMLSQGWELLRIRRITVDGRLEPVRSNLRRSLWTTIEATGMDRVEGILAGRI